MNKDVIYIDVEDDITAIIGRVNDSKEKIVALVPPKRVGVLQSAVNLRLLSRAAQQNNKRLVLITSNHALVSLAASAKLPVAKNLQSKPELAAIPALAVDDEDDIIDGNDLPIGEHAGLPAEDESSEEDGAVIAAAPAAEPIKKRTAGKTKKQINVPNFNTFRKKLMLGVGVGLLAVVFLVWALVFAARATVVISAKTDTTSVNTSVTAGEKLATSSEKGTLKAVQAKQSDEVTLEFTATGRKNVGDKASGTVTLSNQSLSSTDVSAGTQLTSGDDLVFITDSAVTIPPSTVGPGCFPVACPGSVSVGVTAAAGGAKYNGATGSLNGAPDGADASFNSASSGGTDRNVKIVTAADVQKAKEDLVAGDTKQIKNDLKDKFDSEVAILNESFTVDYSSVTSTPAVGAEASSGSGTLTGSVVYRLYGVEISELDTFLDSYMKTELEGENDQRVYDNGADEALFQDDTKDKAFISATLIATAKIGPKINDDEVKEQSKGKKFGDIQEALEAVRGVENVDVKFFPFWVSTVPDDVKRITVEFELDESN